MILYTDLKRMVSATEIIFVIYIYILLSFNFEYYIIILSRGLYEKIII